MSSSLLIKNCGLIITMSPFTRQLKGWDILIEEGLISELSPDISASDSLPVLDASGLIVFPGLINTHHHFYQNLTRNLPDAQNLSLFDWLIYHYPIWAGLDEEGIYISTKMAISELLLSGATSTVDHLYLFPGERGRNFFDVEVTAAREMGIRFFPTRGSMSMGQSAGGLPPDEVTEDENTILKDSERVIKAYHDNSPGSMLNIILAPCAPFSVSEKLMRATLRLSEKYNVRLHTHLAETLDEEHFCLKKYGVRPFEFLESLGWIRENSFFAHSIYLDDFEINRMGSRGAGVSTCPSSNMRLGSGIAPVRKMLDRGVPVSIGVDGSASNDQSNMLLEMRQAMLISRLLPEDQWLTARDVWEMATINGARVLGRKDLGKIEKGCSADLCMVSMKNLSLSGAEQDLAAGLIFSTPNKPVDFTIVNGEVLVENGKLKHHDDYRIITEHRKTARKLLEKWEIAPQQVKKGEMI